MFNGGLLLITNPVPRKIFLITCTILIKTISGNVTKFKKILTWPWTNILLFHSSLYMLRKLIGAFITDLCRSRIWSLDPPLNNAPYITRQLRKTIKKRLSTEKTYFKTQADTGIFPTVWYSNQKIQKVQRIRTLYVTTNIFAIKEKKSIKTIFYLR